MKRWIAIIIPVLVLFIILAFHKAPARRGVLGNDSLNKHTADSGSTAGFILGVQMWTFSKFTFAEALDRVDSTGIKNIEAYDKQKLGGGITGNFGLNMDPASRDQIMELLKKKGIHIIAMGVIVPVDLPGWIKAFEIAKAFGMHYITSEPIKTQWDLIDSLAGIYHIDVAIHDHPIPNPYWSPDSVLAAIKGHRHIGACADVGHWARNGLNPVECLKKLEGHILGVHLKDIVKFNDPNARDTAVGKGVIDFPSILAELKRQNFKGMLSIEQESNWYNNVPDVMFTWNYYEAALRNLNSQVSK